MANTARSVFVRLLDENLYELFPEKAETQLID